MSIGGYLRGVLFRSGPMYEEYLAECERENKEKGKMTWKEAYEDVDATMKHIQKNLSSPSLHDNSKVANFYLVRTEAFIKALKSKYSDFSIEHIRSVYVFAVAHADYMYRLARAREDIETFNGYIEESLGLLADNAPLNDEDKKRIIAYRNFAHYATAIITGNAKNFDEDLATFIDRRAGELEQAAEFDSSGKIISIKECPPVYEPERAAPILGYWLDGTRYDATKHHPSDSLECDFGSIAYNLNGFVYDLE